MGASEKPQVSPQTPTPAPNRMRRGSDLESGNLPFDLLDISISKQADVNYEPLKSTSPSADEEFSKLLKKHYKLGYADAAEVIMRNCMSHSRLLSNASIGHELTSSSRSFIHTLVTGQPLPRIVPERWILPKFHNIASGCTWNSLNREEERPMGILEGEKLTVIATGGVDCVDDESPNLGGEATLVYGHSEEEVKEVKVEVLGTLYASGTVVLVEESGRIWFYNHIEAVDPHYPGFEHRLALVYEAKGEIIEITADMQLDILEKYEFVKVIMDADSDEE
jgi:hypothetical protein